MGLVTHDSLGYTNEQAKEFYRPVRESTTTHLRLIRNILGFTPSNPLNNLTRIWRNADFSEVGEQHLPVFHND